MTTAASTTSTKTGTPTRKHFSLSGPSRAIDPRVDAARGDLADVRLAHRIFAPHYAAAVLRSAVRRTPVFARVGGEPLSEVLAGEAFEVLEFADDFAWGVGAADGAVGFVACAALGAHGDAASLDSPAADYVTVAEAMLGVPAAPGGRSPAGVDAGGLVFAALWRAGVRAPRFVDLQAASLGHAIDLATPVLRGDLLFTDGGVAIATGAKHALRAGAEQVETIALADLDITHRRRLP